MIMNVTLNALLIPRHSYFGAAVATVVSLAVSFALHLGYVLRTDLKPALLRSFGGPLFALAAAWLVVRAATSAVGGGDAGTLLLPIDRGWAPFLATGGAAAAAYVAALVAGRVIRGSDLQLLADLWRRPVPPE
jgi:peptidoglycan biosynthesis protein MviN/MurJ (putative lipid II flippase)